MLGLVTNRRYVFMGFCIPCTQKTDQSSFLIVFPRCLYSEYPRSYGLMSFCRTWQSYLVTYVTIWVSKTLGSCPGTQPTLYSYDFLLSSPCSAVVETQENGKGSETLGTAAAWSNKPSLVSNQGSNSSHEPLKLCGRLTCYLHSPWQDHSRLQPQETWVWTNRKDNWAWSKCAGLRLLEGIAES